MADGGHLKNGPQPILAIIAATASCNTSNLVILSMIISFRMLMLVQNNCLSLKSKMADGDHLENGLQYVLVTYFAIIQCRMHLILVYMSLNFHFHVDVVLTLLSMFRNPRWWMAAILKKDLCFLLILPIIAATDSCNTSNLVILSMRIPFLMSILA